MAKTIIIGSSIATGCIIFTYIASVSILHMTHTIKPEIIEKTTQVINWSAVAILSIIPTILLLAMILSPLISFCIPNHQTNLTENPLQKFFKLISCK